MKSESPILGGPDYRRSLTTRIDELPINVVHEIPERTENGRTSLRLFESATTIGTE